MPSAKYSRGLATLYSVEHSKFRSVISKSHAPCGRSSQIAMHYVAGRLTGVCSAKIRSEASRANQSSNATAVLAVDHPPTKINAR
eukprot:30870-Pelagococcus_subviridis.AAC.6